MQVDIARSKKRTISHIATDVTPYHSGRRTQGPAEVLRESCVGYCPVIESSPTELQTVYTILQRSLQRADQLCQKDVIVVFDQAICANTQQLELVVLRTGTFHTICAFSAAIGKRFAGAGLDDVLVESGIVASG